MSRKVFRLPSGISREDVYDALKSDFWDNPKVQIKPRVVAATIALLTGRRRGEIARLRREDVHRDKRYITRTILKKRPPIRVDLPFGSLLERYLKRRHILQRRPREGLVVPGNPRSRSVMVHYRARKRRGRQLRFHDLRHLYALYMISRGVPLPAIRKLLQHSSLRVTSIYLEMSTRDLEDYVL